MVSARAEPLLAPTGNTAQTVSRRRSPVWLVLALGWGVFFAGFDQTFVVTVLPDMIGDFGLPLDELGRAAWIVNGYLLGYTVVMPLMGRLADAYGNVRLYSVSIGIYMLGSIGAALAPSLTLLTIARVTQAVGGGAVVPIAMAIIAETIAPSRRPLAVGVVAALDDASSLLGPLYAALLVGHIGWRGLFWLNVPLQLPFLIAVWLLARDLRRTQRARVDWLGGLLLAAGLALLTIGLTESGEGRPWALTLSYLALSIAFSAAFVLRQVRVRVPLVQLRLLRRRAARAAMALYFVDGAATITALVTIPMMTNTIWNGSPFDGGVNLMKMMVWMPVGGLVGGLLTQRVGCRPTAALSFALYTAAFVLMWRWPVPPGPWLMWGTLFALGLAIGLNDAPIIGSLLEVARTADRATAAALTQTVQTVGMIVGMALLATQGLGRFDERVAKLLERRGLDATDAEYVAIMHQTYDEVFVAAALVTLAAVGLTIFLSRGRPRELIWSPLQTFENRRGPGAS